VLGILLGGGCSAESTSGENTQAAGGRQAGQVDLQPMNLAGYHALIARQRGKVVVVDVWATYCPPCMRDFHHLVELHHQYDPQKVACISLSLDNEGLAPLDQVVPRVLRFLNQQRATIDNVIMLEDSDRVLRALQLASIPTVLVYGKQGQLLETVTPHHGESPYVRVDQIVAAQLAGAR
jgi:thiol-disulfide isomerase/thioredoxin